VIGVVTEPLLHPSSSRSSYIASSYVKFIEAAGARVVPLIFDAPRHQLTAALSGLNGVLFPGGGARLGDSAFFEAARFIWDHAIKANDAGDHFPIWGTCLGFELVVILGARSSAGTVAGGGATSVDHSFLHSSFTRAHYSTRLNFSTQAATSQMFHYVQALLSSSVLPRRTDLFQLTC